MLVFCLPYLASAMLVLGAPAVDHDGTAAPADGTAAQSSGPSADAAPLPAQVAGPPSPGTEQPPRYLVLPPAGSPTVTTPSGPSPKPAPPDRRTLRVVRLELLLGPVWRIRTTDAQLLTSVEAGRQQGFSGTFTAGIIIAPDRDFVAALDFPIGAGFVARRYFGQRSLFGSVGLTAGVLVHRAASERGVIHRVDPDLQLPLRFGWTVGRVGLSVALLQGFSFRTRTYYRRGIEVWERIPYRIGLTVGLHFDIGAGRMRPGRPARHQKAMP